jgi:hypothetical protein
MDLRDPPLLIGVCLAGGPGGAAAGDREPVRFSALDVDPERTGRVTMLAAPGRLWVDQEISADVRPVRVSRVLGIR